MTDRQTDAEIEAARWWGNEMSGELSREASRVFHGWRDRAARVGLMPDLDMQVAYIDNRARAVLEATGEPTETDDSE